MEGKALVTELAKRLNGIALVSSDISDSDIEGADVESLTAYALDFFKDRGKPGLLDRATLAKIVGMQKKEPVPRAEKVEIIEKADFAPSGKELGLSFTIRNIKSEKTGGGVGDFSKYFSDRLRRLKEIIHSGRNGKLGGVINSISSLGQYVASREVSVAGIVYEKAITKNGHVLVTIDDETGVAKILFPKPQRPSPEDNAVFSEATKIVTDEVIAVRGKLSAQSDSKEPFLIAYYLARPDVPVRQRKHSESELGIAFMSDIHVGSKLFLDKQFDRFLEWINGNVDYKRDVAERIRAVVIAGDLVDGIGVYPNQDRELIMDDIYKQYDALFDHLSRIPDYVHIFILTGNHDAVQRAEPQPQLPGEFIGRLDRRNMHLVSNPGYSVLEGVKVLSYHGTSLDSVIQGIQGCSYSRPESAMVEILKRRHMSPIYGDNPIVPAHTDSMVMDDVPDILHMGHLHKNGYTEYHGTLVVNSGTWQARTSYQVKLGHMPTPAVLPVYEAKSGNLSTVDFNYILE